MTNPTSNFGWQMPTSTDLVTDLPADFETFGQAVDTSLADLKGGTSGQVLSKASNTDMDFTWVAQDDSNAIQNAIVDAKGDLIAASAADTPARLAVGNNGETLVADSSTSTGLRYTANFAAGKNKIINGDFGIWQRGTTVSIPNVTDVYGPDRFNAYVAFTGGTSSWSRQTFTPGTAPVAGYEGQFFARITCGSTSSYTEFGQRIEDVRTFAGQTVTFSFWAKASASLVFTPYIFQRYGSGGSDQTAVNGSAITLTTSWTRYTVTLAVPSISGKTIGTNSSIFASLLYNSGTLNSATIDLWGWQVEAGSVATAFQTATGTLQGELDACRYYYERILPNGSGTGYSGIGHYYDTTNCYTIQNWRQKRVIPTVTFSGATHFTANGSGVNRQSTAVNLDVATTWGCDYRITTSSVTLGSTAVMGIQSTSGWIEASAEL